MPDNPAPAAAASEAADDSRRIDHSGTSPRRDPASPPRTPSAPTNECSTTEAEVEALRQENARLRSLVATLSSQLQEQAEVNAAQLRASAASSGSSPYTSAFHHLIQAASSDAPVNVQAIREWLAFKTLHPPGGSSSCRVLITLDPLLIRDRDGATLLHNAAKVACYPSLKAIIDSRVLPVDVRDWAGRTPLMMALVGKLSMKTSWPNIKQCIQALIAGPSSSTSSPAGSARAAASVGLGADVDAVDLFGRSVTSHWMSHTLLAGKGAKRPADEKRSDEEEFRLFLVRTINEARNKRVTEALSIRVRDAPGSSSATSMTMPASSPLAPLAPPLPQTPRAAPTTTMTIVAPPTTRKKEPFSSALAPSAAPATFASPAFKRLLLSSSSSSSSLDRLFSPPSTPLLPLSQPTQPALSAHGTPSDGSFSSQAQSHLSQQLLSPTGPFSPALLLRQAQALQGASLGVLQPAGSPLSLAVAVRSPMADARLQSLPSRSSLRPPQAVAGLLNSTAAASSNEGEAVVVGTGGISSGDDNGAAVGGGETIRAWAYFAALRIDALSPIRWPSAPSSVGSSASSSSSSWPWSFPYHASPDEIDEISTPMKASTTRTTTTRTATVLAIDTDVDGAAAGIKRLQLDDEDATTAAEGDKEDSSAAAASKTTRMMTRMMRKAPQVVARKVAVPESLTPSSRNIQLRAVELSEELTSGYVSVCSVGPFYVDGDEAKAKAAAEAFALLWNERIRRDAGDDARCCRGDCCGKKAAAAAASAAAAAGNEGEEGTGKKAAAAAVAVTASFVPCPLHGGPGSNLEECFFGLRSHKCNIQGFPLPASGAGGKTGDAGAGAGAVAATSSPLSSSSSSSSSCIDCWLRNNCPQSDPLLEPIRAAIISENEGWQEGEGGGRRLLFCEFSAAAAGKELCEALTSLKTPPSATMTTTTAAVTAALTAMKPEVLAKEIKKRELLMLPPLMAVATVATASSLVEDGGGGADSAAAFVQRRRAAAARRSEKKISSAVQTLVDTFSLVPPASTSAASSSTSSSSAFPSGMFAVLIKSSWLVGSGAVKRNDTTRKLPSDALSMAGRMQGEGRDEASASATATAAPE